MTIAIPVFFKFHVVYWHNNIHVYHALKGQS